MRRQLKTTAMALVETFVFFVIFVVKECCTHQPTPDEPNGPEVVTASRSPLGLRVSVIE